MPPNLDFRAGPLLPHQWATASMMSAHDRERERADRRFESASSENIKAADVPSPLVSASNDGFSDLSRAYQSMMGNGVHFQGSLQAFMDSFVLSSMKKDLKDSHSPVQIPAHGYHDNGEPKAKRAVIVDQEREDKTEAKQSSEPGKPGSQYEPLDLSVSVKPESASGSLPGSSVTIHDNVAWHGCLFCSFSTSSLELMALHLQANHLGKTHPQRSDTGKEPQEESSLTTSTTHSANTKNSVVALDKDGETDAEKNQSNWNNHIDQPYNPFQSDFYRRFGGLYDGSPRGNQNLQGYVGEEESLNLPRQNFVEPISIADDQVVERGSCADVEEDQDRSDDEVAKVVGHAATDTPSTTPKRQPQPNNSDREEDEGEAAEEERVKNGQMDIEAEDDEVQTSHHLQNHPLQLHDDPPLTQRSGTSLMATSSAMKPLPMVHQPKNQGLLLEKQWQQNLGIVSHGGPPGLLKAEQQSHMEQMNMLSVLRAYSNDNHPAYSNDNHPAYNGLGGGATTPGGMKRQEAPGECI